MTPRLHSRRIPALSARLAVSTGSGEIELAGRLAFPGPARRFSARLVVLVIVVLVVIDDIRHFVEMLYRSQGFTD